MNTAPRILVAIAAALCVSATTAAPAFAGDVSEKPCPEESDVAYAVTQDDTLWHIAADSYCLDEWPPLFWGVKKLAQYNKRELGRNPDIIYAGTIVCLPRELTNGNWHADRCKAAASESSSTSTGICGNGRREGTEICDGVDLRGLSCEMLDMASGRLTCRSDCKGLETRECGKSNRSDDADPPKVAAEPNALTNSCATGQTCSCVPCCSSGKTGNDASVHSDAAKPQKPLVVRVLAEVNGGVALPLTRELHDYIYRFVGVAGAGVRVTIGSLDIAPRAFFIYGNHDTNFNNIEQPQNIIGGGLIVQAGWAFDIGPFQLTPGVEVGWLYVKRTIMLNDYPFAGQIETQTGHLPAAGLFLRPSYSFGPKRRVNVALNLSADLILTRLGDHAVSTNFNTMLLGGLGYAL